jgi:hypothetical protein
MHQKSSSRGCSHLQTPDAIAHLFSPAEQALDAEGKEGTTYHFNHMDGRMLISRAT